MKKLFGIFFAFNSFGNCFSPAICLSKTPRFKPKDLRREPVARYILTFRFNSAETTIYFNGVSFWWNSEHLARRFGKHHETDFGGYEQFVSKFLGCHTNL